MTMNRLQLFRLLNLSLLFALAFNLIYFIHELGLVVAGAWLENDPVLFHNNMHYLNMSQPTQTLAYAAGPLAVLLVGLLCLGVYSRLRPATGTFKLFMFWMSYHGLWLFCGQVPEIAFAAQGDFARAVSVLQLSQPIRIVGAVLGCAGLIFLGILAAKPLLATAISDEELATAGARRKLILQSGILPWLLGSILVIPFRVPPLERAVLPFLGGIPLICTLLSVARVKDGKDRGELISKKLGWAVIMSLMGVLFFFRFVLAEGIIMYNLFYQPPEAQPARAYRFVNGNWFNGSGFEAKTFYSIAGVLQAQFQSSVDSTIDLQNKFIIPPYADAHNHHFSDTQDYRAQINMYLAQGIFYAKNPNNTEHWTAAIRPHLNQPMSVDVVFSNGGLTASGGYPIQIYEFLVAHNQLPGWGKAQLRNQAYFIIDDEADLAEQWPRLQAGGPDFIKAYLEYSEEYELRQHDAGYFGRKGLDPKLLPKIVEKAHQDNLRVTAHVNTAMDFHHAIIAGVDEIAHLPLAKISMEDAKLAAWQGTIVVTTTLSHRPTDHVGDVPALHRYNLHLLDSLGVTLAIGTDNNDLTAREEVANLHKLGVFANLELLKIWVENTPQTIFPERRLGRLQEGYEASFLALEGNPLEDFSQTANLSLRFKQGHVIRLAVTQVSISEVLRPIIVMGEINHALEKYHQLKRTQPLAYNFAESELNQLGYQLLNHHKTQEAIAVFKLNVEAYPQSANVYDSLADAYIAASELEFAKACYEKVLELLPHNQNYSEALRTQLEKNAREGLKR